MENELATTIRVAQFCKHTGLRPHSVMCAASALNALEDDVSPELVLREEAEVAPNVFDWKETRDELRYILAKKGLNF